MNEQELTKVYGLVQRTLEEDALNEMGRAAGFMVRARTATAYRVALSLICALAASKVETIADLHRAFVRLTGTDIAYKPFHDRLNRDAFAEFMRGVAGRFLAQLVARALEAVPDGVLEPFDDVLIQDGSSHAVHDALAEEFPGRFTKVSPAAIELHATMSLLNDQPVDISLAPDVVGEREFLPEPADLASKLLLADRGYQDIAYADAVRQAGGSFIIRCKNNLNPVVCTATAGGRRLRGAQGQNLRDLRDRLKGRDADLVVRWSRKGRLIEHRMVFLWNPHKLSHMVLLTNLDPSAFPPATVYAVYRLRWQVELLFKEWRSYANVHKWGTRKAPIVEGLFWASLAAAHVKRFLVHAASAVCGPFPASTRRAAMALPDFIRDLFARHLRGKPIKTALRQALGHLVRYAQRAHPKRDQRTGRFNPGLQPATTGLSHPLAWA